MVRVHAPFALADALAAGDLLALGEQVLDALLAFPDLLLLDFERFRVEKLSPQAGLTS